MVGKHQKLVQSVYPNAIIFEDTHVYKSYEINNLKFAIVSIENFTKKILKSDFIMGPFTLRSEFQTSKSKAWKDAANKIQEKLLDTLQS
jgi:hypothetical protein